MTDLVPARIREARLDAGLTQEQMAPLIGVTLSTMQRYEHGVGKRGITLPMLARIAEVTDKPISWFISEVAA